MCRRNYRKQHTRQSRYNKINNLYHQFSYEITQYGIDSYYKENMSEIARELRLELKKFI